MTFIQVHAGEYPVTLLCELMGVKRSTYYDWQKLKNQSPFFSDREVFDGAAAEVSQAATFSENEFVAEMFSGLMQGFRYPKEAADFYLAREAEVVDCRSELR